jgi:hypothetical protein
MTICSAGKTLRSITSDDMSTHGPNGPSPEPRGGSPRATMGAPRPDAVAALRHAGGSSFFCGFPIAFLGSASMNRTRRGRLCTER